MVQKEIGLISRASHTLRTEGPVGLCKGSMRFLNRYLQTNVISHSVMNKYYSNKNNFDTGKYASPLDPYKIIWVNPNEIGYVTGREIPILGAKLKNSFGMVKDGQWDVRSELNIDRSYRQYINPEWFIRLVNAKRFEDSVLHQSMEQRFLNGKDWENTEFYQAILTGFEKQKEVFWANNKSDLDKLVKRIDNLYSSIESRGLKPATETSIKTFIETRMDSICIDIGRNGEFLFVEGRRRLSIAKILGLSRIPVVVTARHEKWMKHRDYIFENEIEEKHPDFYEFNK